MPARPDPEAILQAIALLTDLAVRAARGLDVERLPREGVDLDGHIERLRAAFMREALERCGGSHTSAARLLRMSFRSFRYYRKKYGLTVAGPQ